jgi:hypothetical protein
MSAVDLEGLPTASDRAVACETGYGMPTCGFQHGCRLWGWANQRTCVAPKTLIIS